MMNANDFRRIALSLPEACEGAHMGHPDFRVGGKIFATLWPDGHWGVVKLTLEQQEALIKEHPSAFEPVRGGWGRRGATHVRLANVEESVARLALDTAWQNTAPKKVLKKLTAG